jgi:peroxiredoxin family protein
VVAENLDQTIVNEVRKAMDAQSTILASMESQLRICQLACESFANMLSIEYVEFETDVSDTSQILVLETTIKSTNIFPILVGIAETNIGSGLDHEWKLLQNRCLGALSNMFLLMDREFMASCNINACDLWNRLYSIQKNDNSHETITSVVGCLSALTRASPLNSINLNYDHIAVMINHYRQSHSSEFQVDIIGILGVFAQYQGNIEANKVIFNLMF